MPIDCNVSYVDASMACDESRVLICLRDSDTGGGYFGGFLINGGTGAGTALDRGFQSAGNEPPYTQDFNVAGEPAGFQCFYVPYTVGTHGTDTLVIEGNDVPQNSCILNFNVDTQAVCNGGAEPPECAVTTLTVDPGDVVAATTLATGGTGTLEVTAVTGSGFFAVEGGTGTGLLVSSSPTAGTYNVNVTVTDDNNLSVTCPIAITINEPAVECPDCATISASNVSSAVIDAGDTLTWRTPQVDNPSSRIVDATGAVVGNAVLVQTVNGQNFWQYTVPGTCDSGTHTVQLNVTGCPVCDLFDVDFNCTCPDPVIDQCNGGSMQLQVGTSMALSVSGCECVDTANGGSIVWSSPDPQVSFNPTNGENTVVSATVTGSYTINVTCTTGV